MCMAMRNKRFYLASANLKSYKSKYGPDRQTVDESEVCHVTSQTLLLWKQRQGETKVSTWPSDEKSQTQCMFYLDPGDRISGTETLRLWQHVHMHPFPNNHCWSSNQSMSTQNVTSEGGRKLNQPWKYLWRRREIWSFCFEIIFVFTLWWVFSEKISVGNENTITHKSTFAEVRTPYKTQWYMEIKKTQNNNSFHASNQYICLVAMVILINMWEKNWP